MASAWGKAWGSAWGNAWGAIDAPPSLGGGGGSAPIWPINPQQHLQALREREEALIIQRNNEALIALLV